MIASKERQHGDRVPKLDKYQTRVLPISAIYGGNASGKTNFFKALNFVKRFVVRGTSLPESLISVEPYLLDKKNKDKPTKIEVVFLFDNNIYEFSFSVTQDSVLEEKLVFITSSSEKVLYHRKDNIPHFNNKFKNDQFLHFAFKGTRKNQLFLTNSVSQNIDTFRPVYDWFKDRLELIAPDSRFEPFERFLNENHPLYAAMNNMLNKLDTGIDQLGVEEIPFENIPFPEDLKSRLQEEIKNGMNLRITNPLNERFIIERKDGRLLARKLVSYHVRPDGEKVKFEIQHESDGSQRIIDLLPAFLDISLSDSNKIYVIDELGRSLHPLLTRRLLDAYLKKCSHESRSQLLVTTHDVSLMDQALLRRDEMWVAERDSKGCTDLISLSEYKEVRYDKNIRKSYLQGRLGGIPNLKISDIISIYGDGS